MVFPLNARENRLPLPRILTTTLSSAWPPAKPPLLPAKLLPIGKSLLPAPAAPIPSADNISAVDLHLPAAGFPPRFPQPSTSSGCHKAFPDPVCIVGRTAARLPA